MSSRLSKIDFILLAPTAGYDTNKLAQLSCICVRQLERHFQQRYRRTPKQWLDELRLETAKELLREGASVKSVAIDLGFKQLSHFSRVYRHRYGYCPSKVGTVFESRSVNDSGCSKPDVVQNGRSTVSQQKRPSLD
jgi:transcriptional regulator GlxA family with amidase domain